MKAGAVKPQPTQNKSLKSAKQPLSAKIVPTNNKRILSERSSTTSTQGDVKRSKKEPAAPPTPLTKEEVELNNIADELADMFEDQDEAADALQPLPTGKSIIRYSHDCEYLCLPLLPPLSQFVHPPPSLISDTILLMYSPPDQPAAEQSLEPPAPAPTQQQASFPASAAPAAAQRRHTMMNDGGDRMSLAVSRRYI
jgi:hypothetical protein